MNKFALELLKQARSLFYLVYVDRMSEDNVYFIGSETETEGVRVRIWFTDWEYETETIVYNNEELAKLIQDELSDRAWFLQHEI